MGKHGIIAGMVLRQTVLADFCDLHIHDSLLVKGQRAWKPPAPRASRLVGIAPRCSWRMVLASLAQSASTTWWVMYWLVGIQVGAYRSCSDTEKFYVIPEEAA